MSNPPANPSASSMSFHPSCSCGSTEAIQPIYHHCCRAWIQWPCIKLCNFISKVALDQEEPLRVFLHLMPLHHLCRLGPHSHLLHRVRAQAFIPRSLFSLLQHHLQHNLHSSLSLMLLHPLRAIHWECNLCPALLQVFRRARCLHLPSRNHIQVTGHSVARLLIFPRLASQVLPLFHHQVSLVQVTAAPLSISSDYRLLQPLCLVALSFLVTLLSAAAGLRSRHLFCHLVAGCRLWIHVELRFFSQMALWCNHFGCRSRYFHHHTKLV